MAPPTASAASGERPRHIAVVLKGYPRLSETFVAQELYGLEQAGLRLSLHSLRHPTDKAQHPIHDRIAAPVNYLPEYLRDDWHRVRASWRIARRRPGYSAARKIWLNDLRRDRTRNRIRRFGQAMVLAAELPPETDQIYAHFLHTPASVARYAAIMRGLPFAISAHAKDIWTSPDWEISEKIQDASWTATCTANNATHLRALSSGTDSVHLVYHGLDFDDLPAARPAGSSRPDGATFRILSVGRLIAKKGYDDLLRALAALPASIPWHFDHIGRWDLKEQLERQAAALGIAERITWHGAQARDAVIEAYRNADLFVLASKIAADGDRDGIPNVLMEAMSQAVPCIATDVSGIPELIEDGVTGWLAPPGDAEALTAILLRAIADPEKRTAVARQANHHVRNAFSFDRGLAQLLALFDRSAPALRAAA